MDIVNEKLKRLQADLAQAFEGEARELRHKIVFAKAIIRMRDGLDGVKNASDPVVT
jgi:hypothetical protein